MNKITTITTRELLRNFRQVKAHLVQGKVKLIEIEQKEGVITIQFNKKKKAKTPFELLLEDIKKHPIKGVKRPTADLYDYV